MHKPILVPATQELALQKHFLKSVSGYRHRKSYYVSAFSNLLVFLARKKGYGTICTKNRVL